MQLVLQLFCGAVDFGDFSEPYDPLREKIIKQNRESIRQLHGDETASVFDLSLEVTRSKTPSTKPEAVIKTSETERPVIKVGDEPKKETESKTKLKTVKEKISTLKAGKKIDLEGKDIDDKKIDLGEVLDDAIDIAKSPKEMHEALAEKAQEKLDPTKKAEEKIEKEKEKAQEKLLDNIIEADNARFRSAAGRAPVDTAFKKKLVSGFTEITGKAPGAKTMELLDMTDGLSKSVLTAMKDGKNLRLAGTAALLSVAGFAIGKGRDKIGKQPEGRMAPDEEEMLRRSLMSDG